MIGLKAPFLACLLVIAGGLRLSVAARVEYGRAVERARYPFVLGATKPFDEVYPRSVFEKRVEHEMARVLEKELTKPGDVTTILEQRDRFEVFRLLAVTEESWKVEAVRVAKVDFDAWFEKARRAP